MGDRRIKWKWNQANKTKNAQQSFVLTYHFLRSSGFITFLLFIWKDHIGCLKRRKLLTMQVVQTSLWGQGQSFIGSYIPIKIYHLRNHRKIYYYNITEILLSTLNSTQLLFLWRKKRFSGNISEILLSIHVIQHICVAFASSNFLLLIYWLGCDLMRCWRKCITSKKWKVNFVVVMMRSRTNTRFLFTKKVFFYEFVYLQYLTLYSILTIFFFLSVHSIMHVKWWLNRLCMKYKMRWIF